ncbi:MAG: 4Fe-4S dicluster domain-containing protein, partial [Planctomycetes bacterium]|nr:4Fe-4S dicluster domain-containing protein [Planctomycetota bacterium]
AARLAKGRGTETAPPPAPELLDVKPADEPRIAVVICRCGMNIAGALDVQKLADYVAELPRVAHVGITPFGCDGTMIKELLSSGEYNRIVVGACSPRTHEPLFQMIAEAGGLNRHLLEIVNLRNHCTWVHAREGKEAVLRKAKRLLRMGVARAALLEPLQAKELPVTQGCLVLGGTPAGIACAAALGRMGFAAHLVIAGDEPGSAFPEKIRAVAARALETVRDDPAVTVHPRSAASAIAGFVGNYTATIRNAEGEQEVAVGAVVVATKEAMGVTEGFEQALYLARDEDGFLVSALGNLNTLDSTTDGVFLCGDARDEVSALSSFISGEAAASRAACILAHPSLTTSPVISRVVDENCDGCAYCVEPCPAHAITLIEYRRGGEIKKTVDINEALCKGCGSCMATCPKRGAHVRNFSPDHFSAMVNALLEAS